jgi:hypothetical protein
MRFISLIEVYEETDQRLYDRDSAKNETLLSAVETNYSLRRVSVNPNHISLMRRDKLVTKMYNDGRLPEGLAEGTEFTKLYITCGTSSSSGLRSVTVVGSLDILMAKIATVTMQ